jgi:hypothetical protein
VRQLVRGEIGTLGAIDALLAEELTPWEGRQIKVALQMAHLGVVKTLSSFAFPLQPSLDRNHILALAGLDFIGRHEVVHLLRPCGTGKNHLAVALGKEAVRAGYTVYFACLADIVASLAQGEREGSLRERVRFLCRTSLLIVDEIGYLPITSGNGNLFFQLADGRNSAAGPAAAPRRNRADQGLELPSPTAHRHRTRCPAQPAPGRHPDAPPSRQATKTKPPIPTPSRQGPPVGAIYFGASAEDHDQPPRGGPGGFLVEHGCGLS